MTNTSPSSRWWENYLVRYFMPSIAGIAIVGWLSSVSNAKMREILFFGLIGKEMNTPTLVLLILYGNLFCYIASYPILGFHVTRMIDFKNSSWRTSFLDGYIQSACVAVLASLSTQICNGWARLFIAFFLVIAFSVAQILRLPKVLKRYTVKGFNEETSLAYAYTYALAKRRGVGETTKSTTQQQLSDEEEFTKEEISEHKTSKWQSEVVETYRHMREHGNSAFIFFLELLLCSLCYLVVSTSGFDAQQQLSLIGLLFAIWAIPAVAIHLLGQILERRFSLFDRRLERANSSDKPAQPSAADGRRD